MQLKAALYIKGSARFPRTCPPAPCVAAPDPCESSSGSRASLSGLRILPPASRAGPPASRGRGAAARMWLSTPLSPSTLPHARSPCCSAGSAAGRSGPSALHSANPRWSFPPKRDDTY